MLFWQALLVGIFCYLGGVDGVLAYGVTFGFYVIGRPLVAGLICGLIFGDVQAGVLCGLAVQGVFIAAMHTGGASSTEITYAGYGGIGLAMATTKDPALAVTLSILIGQTFGLIFYNLRMTGFSYFNRKAEVACANLDKRGLFLNQILMPQIITAIVRIVPVWAAIFFGQGAVSAVAAVLPEVVTTIISVLGGALPALGIAMLMNMLIKNKMTIIFFLFGYALAAFLSLSTLGVLFIALAVAYVIFLCQGTSGSSETTATKMVESNGVYEDADLFD